MNSASRPTDSNPTDADPTDAGTVAAAKSDAVAVPQDAGSPRDGQAASKPARPTAREQLTKYIDNKWIVLGLIFFAMLFLGIPLIWKSRGFNLAERLFWTLATLLWTALVFWLFFAVMYWVFHTIAEALGYA